MNNNSKVDLEYGGSYFRQWCSSCHQPRSGVKNAPSIYVLYNSDSIALYNKLKNILTDSVHKNFFEAGDYSEKEIRSIHAYIKDYFKSRY